MSTDVHRVFRDAGYVHASTRNSAMRAPCWRLVGSRNGRLLSMGHGGDGHVKPSACGRPKAGGVIGFEKERFTSENPGGADPWSRPHLVTNDASTHQPAR